MDTETACFINKEQLSDYLAYDKCSPSGLRWLVSIGNIKSGTVAGTLSANGYYRVKFKGQVYQAHRIVWVLFNDNPDPLMIINHIDCNTSNNTLENLEVCTRKENSNRSKLHKYGTLRSNNTSGINGVQEVNTGKYLYARVTWNIDNKVKRKDFSYSKLGKEGAWAAAKAFKETNGGCSGSLL